MTHSHDTSTPAMSAETVPSEEAMTFTYTNWRGETGERCVAPDGIRFRFGRSAWHAEPQWLMSAYDFDKAAHREFAVKDIVFAAPTLSASHLAKEGGEAGAMEAEVERLSKVYAEATGYYVPFHAGLHSESSNRIRTGIKAVLAAAPQPSPALAKGGDVVREGVDAANLFTKLFLSFIGRDRGTDRFEKTLDGLTAEAVKADDKIEAARRALSTPTEGPDTAAEERDALLKALGFLPGPFKDELSRKVILDDVAGLRPAMVKAREAQSEAEFAAARDQIELAEIRAELLAGQGDDDGLQILPDLKEGQTVLQMVCECIALLETRRDIVEAITPTEGPASQTEGMGGDAEARRKRASELMAPLMELSEDELILLRHSLPVETLARLRAALTPPETAEAVPVAAADPAPATDDWERLVDRAYDRCARIAEREGAKTIAEMIREEKSWDGLDCPCGGGWRSGHAHGCPEFLDTEASR